MMINPEPITIFAKDLSDPVPEEVLVSRETADFFFAYFKQCSLFRWHDANNDCEDRANAICLLLKQWKMTSFKAWVFSGTYLKKDNGTLTNCWNYHVAAILPVREDNKAVFYVLDPATLDSAETIEKWALQITATPHSYHLVKEGVYYIFNPASINKDVWYKQNRQNYKWTIQGLAGINGVSQRGKAQLVFQKRKIHEKDKAFRRLLYQVPDMRNLETKD